MSNSRIPADYRDSHQGSLKGSTYETDLAAAPFDAYMAAREAQILTRILPQFFPAGVPRYLDFACGTGRITRLVENMAGESCGIDISAGMLEQARATCKKTTFLESDVTTDQPDLQPFQLVTSFRFLGNAQDELRAAALKAIHRLLAPGGLFVFNNHCNPGSLHSLLVRLRGAPLPPMAGGGPINFDHARMKRLLEDCGFRLVATYGIGLWVIRSSFMRDTVLHSRVARLLEPLSRLPFVGRFCPDAILVARRVDAPSK